MLSLRMTLPLTTFGVLTLTAVLFLSSTRNYNYQSIFGVVVNAMSTSSGGGSKKYYGGAGVGRFVVNANKIPGGIWQCHYDMVLTERIQGRPPTESGLFVPQQDLPRLHLCRVLAVGPGQEYENGRVEHMGDGDDIHRHPLQVGDVIIAKNPWGIGPKDEETADGKKLSFMRAQDICAVITGGIVSEDE